MCYHKDVINVKKKEELGKNKVRTLYVDFNLLGSQKRKCLIMSYFTSSF